MPKTKMGHNRNIFLLFLVFVFISSLFVHEAVHVWQLQNIGVPVKEITFLTVRNGEFDVVSVVANVNISPETQQQFENEAWFIQFSYIFLMLVTWHYSLRKKLL